MIACVSFMLLYACIGWCVLRSDPALQEYIPRNGLGPLELIHQGFADQITMYLAIVVAAHAYQYFEKLRKQEMESVEFQRALAASELQALKMQLHPHFLFNTLHGISTLIDTDQASAKEMVVKLSTLLRGTLEHSSSDLIPLREELKFVREYLDLEAMRLGTRLNVEWSIDSDTGSTLVPQLILQTLVEVSGEITSTLNLDRVLQAVVNHTQAIIAFERAAIALEQRGALQIKAISGDAD